MHVTRGGRGREGACAKNEDIKSDLRVEPKGRGGTGRRNREVCVARAMQKGADYTSHVFLHSAQNWGTFDLKLKFTPNINN